MSEYQYYEFRAIDRPLSAEDKKYLRSLSSRAEISSNRFVNHYEWGSFKGDPLKLMHRCFDLHVYYANWGTRTLMLRISDDALDAKSVSGYLGDTCSLHPGDGHVVINLGVSPDDPEGYDFDYYEGEDDDSWADQLASIRELLLAGDMRPLYLGWLAGIFGLDEDEPEPPVPPGLRDLPTELESLVEFLGIGQDVLNEAAGRSPALAQPEKSTTGDAYRPWIATLPVADKDAALLQLMQGNAATVQKTLHRRFLKDRPAVEAKAPKTDRTVADLLEAAQAAADERKKREAEARRRKAEQKAREAAIARKQFLLELAKRYESAWRKVQSEILQGGAHYKEAAKQLIDLRDAAMLSDPPLVFERRLQALIAQHAKKPNLMKALRAARLI